MNNKKAQFQTLIRIELAMVIFAVIILFGSAIFAYVVTINEHQKTCKKLDMEVLSESAGGIFTEEQLTCWNPETKEVKKIK